MLLPVLKSATWDGLRGNARIHVWIGTPTYPMVIVAYADLPHGEGEGAGTDSLVAYALGTNGDDIGYVTTATEYGRSEQLIVDSFANFDALAPDFDLVEDGSGRMLVSAGHPMAAEHALSEASMLLAHEKLDAEEIVVSIARRGSLLACALDSNDHVRKTITSIHTETFQEAAMFGVEIVENLLVYRNGSVTGLLDAAVSSDGDEVSWTLAHT